jgi:hypothetical protein
VPRPLAKPAGSAEGEDDAGRGGGQGSLKRTKPRPLRRLPQRNMAQRKGRGGEDMEEEVTKGLTHGCQ